MSESALEKRVVKLAKSMGIYTRKFTSPSHRAVPDRIFIYGGGVLFIEFKAPKKLPTDFQWVEIESILLRGCSATFVDNFNDAEMLINRLHHGGYEIEDDLFYTCKNIFKKHNPSSSISL
jgi:hypothetical protein